MATLDCSKYSKPVLKNMLGDAAFSVHHEAIKAFLAPKPKDYSPVEGKEVFVCKKSGMILTLYPKGYVRFEIGRGNGCCYAEGIEEVSAKLAEWTAAGKIKAYRA
jgi:hypothetical protein